VSDQRQKPGGRGEFSMGLVGETVKTVGRGGSMTKK